MPVVSVFDFIPGSEHAAIQAETSTADLTTYLQDALDAIDALPNGGELFFPRGRYHCTAPLTLYPGTRIVGENQISTTIEWNQAGTTVAAGSGLVHTAPINSSTAARIQLENIGLQSTNASNLGAAFYDTGGTFLALRSCLFVGFKYGVIFDQSELADVDLCDFEGQLRAGAWLVNGPDLTPGAATTFTNRISINRSQFNGTGTYAIQDDGGYAHAYRDNNFNGYATHVRAAGVLGLLVDGGEFESASGPCIQLTNLRASGTGVGNCHAHVCNAMMVPQPGQAAISISNIDYLTLTSNYFSASVAAVQGLFNCGALFSTGNRNAGASTTLFDGPASYQVSDELYRAGTASWNPPSLAHGASASTTVNVATAALGDFVDSVSFSASLQGCSLDGYVSAAGVVTVVLSNMTGASVDLGAGTVRARIDKGR